VIRVYRRDEWSAKDPCRALPKIKSPTDWIMLSHTVQQECHYEDVCSQQVRNMQIEMRNCNPSTDRDDVPYGFIIGGTGFIYEGRGFEIIGEHTAGERKHDYLTVIFI
jgi:hypothetical protein